MVISHLAKPKRIATIGGILLSISGVVDAGLGARIRELFYDACSGGKMGHVGVIAGLVAIVIGLIIVYVVVPLYVIAVTVLAVFPLGALVGLSYIS